MFLMAHSSRCVMKLRSNCIQFGLYYFVCDTMLTKM